MTITQSIICNTGGAGLPSLTQPSLCVMPEAADHWLCGFRGGPTKADVAQERALLAVSRDGGQSWTEPTEPFVDPMPNGKPGTLRGIGLTPLGGQRVCALTTWVDASEPDKPFFDAESEVLLDCQLFMSISEDGGRTWPALQRIEAHPYNQPTPATGPIVALPDGRIMCQFELNKGAHQQGDWVHKPVIKVSADDGRSWGPAVTPAHDPGNRIYYWDQRPTALRDGTLINAYWVYDRQASSYMNTRVNFSHDSGQTWTQPIDIGFEAQPSPVVELPDGRLVMVYMDRTQAVAVRARISEDHGQTWPEATQVTIAEGPTMAAQRHYDNMADAWRAMEKQFAMGLPSAVVTKEGDIAITYYGGEDVDHTTIHLARFTP